MYSEVKIGQNFKQKKVLVRRTGKGIGASGEITAKVGNELKLGKGKEEQGDSEQ